MSYDHVCLAGYTDDRCSTIISFCESGPCYNGGSCIAVVNGYKCTCRPGTRFPYFVIHSKNVSLLIVINHKPTAV